jgi:hypothetical protein
MSALGAKQTARLGAPTSEIGPKTGIAKIYRANALGSGRGCGPGVVFLPFELMSSGGPYR